MSDRLSSLETPGGAPEKECDSVYALSSLPCTSADLEIWEPHEVFRTRYEHNIILLSNNE